MKQLVTSIEPDRLGAVMSKLQEARVGPVRLRQAAPRAPGRALASGRTASTLILEVAVPEDRLHGAIEAIAAGAGLPGGKSAILLHDQE